MTNQEKYNSLRKRYPEFVYDRYQYDVQPDGLHIVFSFRMGEDCRFAPEAVIARRPFLDFDQPRELLDLLVFNIGMVELVSYWKCACPPRVRIDCGVLDEYQRGFWKKLYWHGLGEFFYVNGIEEREETFLELGMRNEELGIGHTPQSLRDSSPNLGEQWARSMELGMRNEELGIRNGEQLAGAGLNSQHYLVPIGGGKDSVVSLELLRGASGVKVVPLIMNPRGATVGCIEAAGYTMDDVLVIHRTIDPRLLELNAQGFLNGHTPFSAMLAFYTLLASQLSGIPNIALSNESSANESTVIGTGVNHQYSKSLEFENDFREYVNVTFNKNGSCFNYFSLLRPLSELQIAMLFSRYEKYYDVFRSCNVGSKQDVWCGHCAKCLFAYIILSPFIAPARLAAIFGKNMLDDAGMQKEFAQLTGEAETKPFECVGTVSEVHEALGLTLSRWYDGELGIRNGELGMGNEELGMRNEELGIRNEELGMRNGLPCLLRGYVARPPMMRLDACGGEHNLGEREMKLLMSHVQGVTA